LRQVKFLLPKDNPAAGMDRPVDTYFLATRSGRAWEGKVMEKQGLGVREMGTGS